MSGTPGHESGAKLSSTTFALIRLSCCDARMCASEQSQAALLAGTSPLTNLPLPILYNISKYLDIYSQRSLFLANKQLYNSWHIQISEKGIDATAVDSEWNDISWFLDLLPRFCHQKIGHAQPSFVKAYFATGSQANIHCLPAQQALSLKLYVPQQFRTDTRQLSPSKNLTCGPFPTKDDLFHKLLGGPSKSLSFSNIWVDSTPGANWYQLRSLAQNLFATMKSTKCSAFLDLQLGTRRLDNDRLGDVILISYREGIWAIDYEPCILSPPELDFDDMPKIVTRVGAGIFSTGAEQRDWDLQIQAMNFQFDPDCELKHNFAYQGNVDIEAWVQEHHETAEAFYLHADDFLHEGYDLDDFLQNSSDQEDVLQNGYDLEDHFNAHNLGVNGN